MPVSEHQHRMVLLLQLTCQCEAVGVVTIVLKDVVQKIALGREGMEATPSQHVEGESC